MKNNFDEIWERIKSETNLSSFKDLGEIIDRTGPAVSGAKAKNEFPPGWAYLVGKKFGLLTEWIMTGEGPKRINEATKSRKLEILNQVEEWLNEEIRMNPGRETWFEFQMMDFFESFKKWKRKRDETINTRDNFPSSKVA